MMMVNNGLWVLSCSLVLFLLLNPSLQRNGKNRLDARIEGDVILGALFPVHYPPSQKSAYTRTCGPIWEQYGMHRIELFFLALDEINSDDSILPNITLGCDIRDSCWYSPVALENSIDFIKDSIADMQNPDGSNSSDAGGGCQVKHNKPIAGLIGPGSSSSSIQVQNLLSIFTIPQIGYSATSSDLSDKSLYKYFVRVVPPDRYQAQAMIDIVLRYNWTYVSAVHTEGSYGSSGMDMFKRLAKTYNVCIATSDNINSNAHEEAFDRLVESIMETSRAKVVVCFCEGMTVKKFFQATQRQNVVGKFLLIGSDGWATRPDVVKHNMEEAAGGISIKLYSPPISYFDRHFLNLRPHNNSRNPWFKEFWQQKFNCYLEGENMDSTYSLPCTGTEEIVDYEQDAKLGFVRKAIYAMAYALNAMQIDLCGGKPGMCPAMERVPGSLYFKYLMNTSFVSKFGEEVHFDENGDPPGRYDIMNFQRFEGEGDENATYAYVKVGSWNNGVLVMNDTNIYWPGIGRYPTRIVESVCSKPCKKGYVKKTHPGRATCCWTCNQCNPNEILLDESRCKPCSKGWWPNTNLTACRMIKIEHMNWHFTEAIVAIVMACVGILTTCFVAIVFIRYNNTPVVKASTRELSYIILGGIIFALTSNFVLVAKPTIVTCYFTRIIPGLSFSCIYGALVTKTNRIARILEGSKKIMTKKPRFMSASAQVVITCLLIGVESTIITIMLVIEPADSTFYYPTEKRVILLCNTTPTGTIVPLGFDLFLIVMCTLYAVKTRNLPENFNEAKFIGFTMYTTCVIWLGFLPIYFESESKVFTMCVSVSLSAIVALVLLFFPKVYIIIYCPEKNTRSAFTTSKDVRCHIGNTGRSFSSSDSLDGYRDILTKRRQRSLIDKWKTRGLQRRGLTPSPNPSLAGRITSPSSQGYLKHDGMRSQSYPKLNPTTKTYTWKDRQQAAGDPLDSTNMAVAKTSNATSGGVSAVSAVADDKIKSSALRKRSSQIQDMACQTDAEILGVLLAFLRNHIRGGADPESGEKSFFSGLNDKIVTFSGNEVMCNQDTSNSRPFPINSLPITESPKETCSDCIPGHTLTSEKSPLLSADDDLDMLSMDDTNPESGKEFSFSSSLREFPFMLKRRQKTKNNEEEVSELSWMAQSSAQGSIETTPENCLFPSVSESPNPLATGPRKILLTPQSSFDSRDNEKDCNGYDPSSGTFVESRETNGAGSSGVGVAVASSASKDACVAAMATLCEKIPIEKEKRWSGSSGNASFRQSLEEMSMHGLTALEDEEVSMEKFVTYLKKKGICVDESSLQSSDV